VSFGEGVQRAFPNEEEKGVGDSGKVQESLRSARAHAGDAFKCANRRGVSEGGGS